MKKSFITPELKVVKIRKASIIATSGCAGDISCSNKECSLDTCASDSEAKPYFFEDDNFINED